MIDSFVLDSNFYEQPSKTAKSEEILEQWFLDSQKEKNFLFCRLEKRKKKMKCEQDSNFQFSRD